MKTYLFFCILTLLFCYFVARLKTSWSKKQESLYKIIIIASILIIPVILGIYMLIGINILH